MNASSAAPEPRPDSGSAMSMRPSSLPGTNAGRSAQPIDFSSGGLQPPKPVPRGGVAETADPS
jgi:hypothetical protein